MLHKCDIERVGWSLASLGRHRRDVAPGAHVFGPGFLLSLSLRPEYHPGMMGKLRQQGTQTGTFERCKAKEDLLKAIWRLNKQKLGPLIIQKLSMPLSPHPVKGFE